MSVSSYYIYVKVCLTGKELPLYVLYGELTILGFASVLNSTVFSCRWML